MKWIVFVVAGVAAFALLSDQASAAFVPTVADSQAPGDQVSESDATVIPVVRRYRGARVYRGRANVRVYTSPRYVYPRASRYGVYRYGYGYPYSGYGVYVAPYSGFGVQVYRGPSAFYYRGW